MLRGSRRAGILLVLWWSAWAGISAQDDRPAPKASSAVQKVLDEGAKLAKTGQLEAALQSADGALQIAREDRDAVGEAQAQCLRARIVQDLGRSADAIAAWQQAAAAWAAAGDGPGHVEALTAEGLLVLAREPERANALLADALRLARAESLRPLGAAQALMASGTLYREQGRLTHARQFYEAALDLREKLTPNSSAVAESLNSVGDIARRQGKLTEAETYHQRALALQEKVDPNSLVVAAAFTGLGNIATNRGDPLKARDYFQRAVALHEKLDPNSSALAWTWNNLGIVSRELGDFTAAEANGRRAVALHEKISPDSLDVAAALTNLSNCEIVQGHMSEARDLLQRALAIKEKRAPGSLTLAATLTSLGIAARTQGDFAAAANYHERALAIEERLAPGSLTMALTLTNLGIVKQDQGDLDEAAEFHKRALAVQQKIGTDLPDTASTLTNLGNVAYQQGDLDAARDSFERALAIWEKLAPNSLALALNFANLANVAYAGKDFATAADYYQRALNIKEALIPRTLTTATTLDGLALTVNQLGHLAEAERLAARAWALARDQAQAVSGDEARQGFGASTAFLAAHLLRFQVALGKADEAFVTLEEGRAQALQQLLSERRITAAIASPGLLADYQSAITARDRAEQAVSRASVNAILAERKLSILRRSRAATPASDLARAEVALSDASKERATAESAYTADRLKTDQLWSEIKKGSPRTFTPPVTLAQARELLPAGVLFVAFSVGEEQSQLFLLSAGRPVSAYVIDATLEQLRSHIAAFRTQLTDPDSDAAETLAASRALFARLFPREARQSIGNARRLLISPDGPLWDVSFAALATSSQGAPKYLGIEKAITYTPSLTLFAQLRNDKPRPAAGSRLSAVVVGNPIFDRPGRAPDRARTYGAGGDLDYLFADGRAPAPLPATQKEASEIASLYRGVLLTGENATEASLRKWIESADVIHLATHGYLQPTRPMSSGVLLTLPKEAPGTDETSNDGVLQAWEIYSQLHLRAELVVLSGCETARGRNVQGEGVIGLTRALQYAGARAIIASQWKVDDESTRILMIALHRNLRKGMSKDEALREAMVALRVNRRTSHPYDWAPFILIGDPEFRL